MSQDNLTVGGANIRCAAVNTLVVGSGAAGFNAADRLYGLGQTDVALVTEGINDGTSRNTGSDKQTYYKLSLSGDDGDSVAALAKVLFAGQCVDGDNALCEAALSARCFLRLVELGVPFPQNRYGEFVGYKTDHDPSRRATSVGPYTSKLMTESLERSVREKGITVFDNVQLVRLLTDGKKIAGALGIDKTDDSFVLFSCRNLVLATGGPAGIYADSVYPVSQFGASGLAFEAGAGGQNLTEWQFGLASVAPRWNVSGTYMQVLPRFYSCAADLSDEREFLSDFFSERGDMLTRVFLKGYQWPFDVRKLAGGSSMVDILVYIETKIKGRRVFLDFTRNPDGREIDFSALSAEAREYLERSGACFGTPIERLLHMNAPAVDFYADKGVDLRRQPLEIALCAQHNNGGLAVDCWWQTDVEGLFAVGEVAGTHGVYRPGGSALNSGQVGSTRAAVYINARRRGKPAACADVAARCAAQINECLALAAGAADGDTDVDAAFAAARQRMSRAGGAVRNAAQIDDAIKETRAALDSFARVCADKERLPLLFRARDTLLCQLVYLTAMAEHLAGGGRSRGSALYTDADGQLADAALPEIFRFTLDDGSGAGTVQQIYFCDGACSAVRRPVRPIPQEDDFFENVWRSFRENGNIC